MLELYNTLSREIEEFKPIDSDSIGVDPPQVKMYTCGPTVYREVHIGNFRTYITSDILRRVLDFNNYQTKTVMNITDVGHMRLQGNAERQIDPILEESLQQGIMPLEIAKRYTNQFLHDAKQLNIQPPDVMPCATDHIAEMIKMIEQLVEKKFAYITDGNVYFNVKRFKRYGRLSGNTLDKMDALLEAVRVSVETDKKDSIDFALWKKADKDRMMQWDSPWGKGFPGWHIECSAMSTKYLGNHFDIHAGGEDLIFPHHEDEIAQAEAASNEQFVNYWIHTNFLLVNGEKMSRSKGNVYTIPDIQKKKFSPLAFRYLTFLTHYRTRMNFTWKGLQAAQSALEKLYDLSAGFPKPTTGCLDFEERFLDAVNNDLNMPKAISIMWEMLRSDNPDSAKAATLFKIDGILGLNIREASQTLRTVPEEIIELAKEREKLRKQRKFHLADETRIKIEKRGYIVKDSKKGPEVLRKI